MKKAMKKAIISRAVDEKEILKALTEGQQEEVDLAITLNYSLSELRSKLYQLKKQGLVKYLDFSDYEKDIGLTYLTYWELEN